MRLSRSVGRTGLVAAAGLLMACIDGAESTVGDSSLTYRLQVEVLGEGELVSDPPAILCPGFCSARFPEGTLVELTATPIGDERIDGWMGACSSGSAAACTVTLTSSMTVSVRFRPEPRFAIGGTVRGLHGTLELRLDGANFNERLRVQADGSFVFPTALATNESYEVRLQTLPNEQVCRLSNGRGTVAGASVSNVEVLCDGVADLADLRLTVPSDRDRVFDPGRLEQDLNPSILVREAGLVATTLDEAATVTIDGVPALSGVPTAVRPLDLGTMVVNIVVQVLGFERVYRVRVNRGEPMTQFRYFKAEVPQNHERFGHDIALWNDTLAISAKGEGGWRSNAGVFIYRRNGSTWRQTAAFMSGDDKFGRSIALFEDVLIVGADECVHIYRRDSEGWRHVRLLVADEGRSFGSVVALRGDTIAVYSSGSTYGDGGMIHVFRAIGIDWALEATIQPSNRGAFDFFGSSLALDEHTLVVGAPGESSAAQGVNGFEDDESAPSSGAAYVFTRTGTVWHQEAYLKASNSEAEDHFGSSVAMDGDVLVVGAPEEGSDADGVNNEQFENLAPKSGAVYVFRRGDAGWRQEAYVKASNSDQFDRFGNAVALLGPFLAVGASSEDSLATGIDGDQFNDDGSSNGAVYLFNWSAGAWVQRAYIKASNSDRWDSFGSAVAMSKATLAVGAPREGSADPTDQSNNDHAFGGAVYIFH